ncbi:MAG: 50S ribosomal protein L32 [Patescibacteria group bacterium]
MAEPKKRLTSSRSGWRRSHQKIKKLSLSTCPKCKTRIIPHRVCSNCGFYKGKDILKLDEKAKIKEQRRKKKETENE